MSKTLNKYDFIELGKMIQEKINNLPEDSTDQEIDRLLKLKLKVAMNEYDAPFN